MPRGGRGKPWSDEDVAALIEIAGDVPRPMVHRVYNQKAATEGRPPRTDKAIKLKAVELGLSLKAAGTWLTMTELAKLLDVTPQRVDGWAHRHPSFPRRKLSTDSRVSYLYRPDLIKWFKLHPHVLAGIDKTRLFALLEDEELAEEIAAAYPVMRGVAVPIQCLDTGRIYPNCEEAARHLHVSPCWIRHALQQGRSTIAGYRLRRINR